MSPSSIVRRQLQKSVDALNLSVIWDGHPTTLKRHASNFPVTFSAFERYYHNVNSFRDFYKEHKDKFFAYLMRCTGDYFLSGDIMQESFTRYLEKYSHSPSSLALLYTIGRNLLFDRARKQSLENKSAPEIVRPGSLDDTERYLMVRDEYRQVLAAMQQLESSERDILALTVSSGLSYRDIASIAGISESNVKLKVHRARIKLRKIIQAGK